MIRKLVCAALIALTVISISSCRRRTNGNVGRENRVESETDIYAETSVEYRRSTSRSSPEPDEQKIKQDLVGKTIMEPTREVYRSKFQVRLVGSVLNVDISNKEKDGNQLYYKTKLILSDDINTYLADVNITYVWDNREWTILYLESKYLDIMPTGKFDNCIIVKTERPLFAEQLFWYNNCSVALIVEGYIYAWSFHGQKREWQYFSDEVPANGKAYFYSETDVTYRITRIERP